jgi:hypothetical protein
MKQIKPTDQMIYIQASKPEDWKALLADPEKHWKRKYSAHSLAHVWQNATGFPQKVQHVFDSSGIVNFNDIKMILGIPEYKVALPGGARASQNDLFVITRTPIDLIIIMVEGKVDESFGPIISDWEKDNTEGKTSRLDFLKNLLNISHLNIRSIRYQLLHRTASAVLTAQKFNCTTALVLIHSFSDSNTSFSDYQKFLLLYGLSGKIDNITGPINLHGVNTFWGWIKDTY